MIELYELNPHKMTTSQEKAQCVSWFIETKSDIALCCRRRCILKPNFRTVIVLCKKTFLFTVACVIFLCEYLILPQKNIIHVQQFSEGLIKFLNFK